MDLKIPRGEKKGAGGFSMVQRDLFWNSALATAGEAQLGEPLCFHFVRDWGGGGVLQGGASVGMEPGPLGQQSLPLGGVASLRRLPWLLEAHAPGFLPFPLFLRASSGFSGDREPEALSPYFYLFISHLPHPTPCRLRVFLDC